MNDDKDAIKELKMETNGLIGDVYRLVDKVKSLIVTMAAAAAIAYGLWQNNAVIEIAGWGIGIISHIDYRFNMMDDNL